MNSFRLNTWNALAIYTAFLLMSASCALREKEQVQREPLLLIVRMVNYNGWRSCGSVWIEHDGNYTYTNVLLWSPKQPSEIHRGQVPTTLLTNLVQVAN